MPGKPRNICDRTFEFARDVVNFCLSVQAHPAVRWELFRQLVRAGTAVGAKVAAAQTTQSRADFVTQTTLARQQVRETIFWLRLIKASHISDSPCLQELIEEAQELQRIFSSIIKNVREKA